MAASFVRLFAFAPFLALWACSPLASTEGAKVSFAVSSSMASAPGALPATNRIGQPRVLSRRVNLQEPIRLGIADGAVTVTFAVRQLEGVTMAIDPTSLVARATAPFEYTAHPRYETPPHLVPDASRVRLADGRSLSVWHDDAVGIVAQIYAADGSAQSPPIAVSPSSMHVIGAPRAATADGRRVVVAFLACGEEGFDLVASSFDATP